MKLFKACFTELKVYKLTWQQQKSWQVDSSVQFVRHLCRRDRRLSAAASDIPLKLEEEKKLHKKLKQTDTGVQMITSI